MLDAYELKPFSGFIYTSKQVTEITNIFLHK